MRVDCPILFLFERLDFALTLDDQAKGDSLYASSGKAAADFVPEQRRNLIADQSVEHTPCLLRIDQMLINIAWMFKRFLYRPLRNLVERHAPDALVPVLVSVLLLF